MIRVSETRRRFLENVALLAPAALIAPWVSILQGCTRSQEPSPDGVYPDLPEGVTPVSEETGTARALEYVHDAADAPPALRPEGANQFCHNCRHFTRIGESGFGDCALIQEGAVSENGWCNAWVLTPEKNGQ